MIDSDRVLRGVWSTREMVTPEQLKAAMPILSELARPLAQLDKDGRVLIVEMRVLVYGVEWQLAPVTVLDPTDDPD